MAMRFGLFGSAQANGTTLEAGVGQGFHDYIDYNIEAEALGYQSTFLVEHHFTGWSQVSATLNLLTWLAAKTSTIRIGTAVIVVPWHNPVLLAEQAATLDLLSGGRLDFGVGKGYRHTEFHGFNIPIEEAEARFEEAMDIILRAWTSRERFSHQGRFWAFNDVIVEPAPAQQPHPPLWMSAGSEASIRRVARRGSNLMLDQYAGPALIAERIAIYKAALAEHGRAFDPASVAAARDLYVAKDAADKEAALERLNANRARMIAHARDPNQAGGSHILSYSQAGLPDTSTALVGTADEIEEKMATLAEVGVECLLFSAVGGSRESLRRFARDIMPGFSHTTPIVPPVMAAVAPQVAA
jgi:alkanesulfonate monooxygenase SsuD/methylene tetrahydromethanopterin reductase-like flavin-dependent oxidoreductase (luciferase family)